jgi:pantoate--beta-alanine ligase
VARTRAELDAARRSLTGRVVLVPTMGALHEGHRALIRAARTLGDHVIVSIFVNPTQFGPGEDLDRYPRTPWADLDMCAEEGVPLVFMPGCEQMFGPDLGIRVDGGALASRLEGASRPAHFSGVLTVVAKLFGLVDPHAAVFGEKDYQQLVLIRAMSRELALGVEVHALMTVREEDGMALSSRNRYLDEHQRVVARTLSRALRAGVSAAGYGRPSVLAAAQRVLDAEPELAVDYLALTDPELGPAPESGPARLLVAARLGSTRLIDNLPITLGTDR